MKERSTTAQTSRIHSSIFLVTIALACAFGIPSQARAIGYEQIHSFGFPELMGELPMTPPIRASDGALYGTTSGGGRFSRGVIYRLDSDGTQYRAILHMGSTGNDAETPSGEVVEGSDGALYGASYWGGNLDIGTVFKANKDGSGYSVLFHFNGANGRNPVGSLTEDGNGFLYGTTLRGGVNNVGVLFRLQKNGTGFQLLHQFGGGDGRYPKDGVFQGTDGKIYGITEQGGSQNAGVLYRLNNDGAGYEIFHDFSTSVTNGVNPMAGIIQGSDGAFYGTTRSGGELGSGTIYKLNTDGSGFTIIHSFGFGFDTGKFPEGRLIEGSDGMLYGTTSRGGDDNGGIIFRVAKDGSDYEMLHNFIASTYYNGSIVESALLETTNGFLLGVTRLNGDSDRGLLFQIKKDGSDYSQLHTFNETGGDGQYGYGRITEGNDGRIYGACVNGGFFDGGIVFRSNKDGSDYKVLHHFSFSPTNGLSPWGNVIEGNDGALYGATRHGGTFDAGVVFKLDKEGTNFAIIHNFTTNSGEASFPMNSVIEASDGRLYGRTISGGSGDGNAIFGLNKDGSGYQVLHSFASQYSDYYIAYSGLIEGTDGALYGTTYEDGLHEAGSVFKVNKDGSGFVSLRDFADSGSDARYPEGGVMEASNGRIYGTSGYGGIDDWGALFSLNKDGSGYTVLHHFSAESDDGYAPTSALVEGPGGVLYGTTYFGGNSDYGTIYKINQNGSGFAIIYRFRDDDDFEGWGPYPELTRLSDGGFYGATFGGGQFWNGTIFRIKPVEMTMRPASNGLNLLLSGFIGQRYMIQSANLLPPVWSNLTTVTNMTGTVEFLDHPGNENRFYRAQILEP